MVFSKRSIFTVKYQVHYEGAHQNVFPGYYHSLRICYNHY